METVYVLLPLGLVLAAVAVGMFVWAVRRGQFDDLETPAMRMLFDDEPARPKRDERGTDEAPGAAKPGGEGDGCSEGERRGS